MVRPGPPRVRVNVRLSATSVEWLDKLAEAAGQDRSTAMRAALAVASQHQSELVAALGKQA